MQADPPQWSFRCLGPHTDTLTASLGEAPTKSQPSHA